MVGSIETDEQLMVWSPCKLTHPMTGSWL